MTGDPIAVNGVIQTSPWSPAMVTALVTAVFGGFAFVIAALGKVLVDLKAAKGKAVEAAQHAVVAVKAADEVKKTVEASRVQGEEAGRERDRKLDLLATQNDTLTTQGIEIKSLVDGKFSQVLDRVAKLTRSIADTSGDPGDEADADEAEIQAEKQRDKVLAASLGAGVVVDGTLTVTDGKATVDPKAPQ